MTPPSDTHPPFSQLAFPSSRCFYMMSRLAPALVRYRSRCRGDARRHSPPLCVRPKSRIPTWTSLDVESEQRRARRATPTADLHKSFAALDLVQYSMQYVEISSSLIAPKRGKECAYRSCTSTSTSCSKRGCAPSFLLPSFCFLLPFAPPPCAPPVSHPHPSPPSATIPQMGRRGIESLPASLSDRHPCS
jgi:hypothetical protein